MQNQPQINPSTTVKPKKTNLLAILILVAFLLGAIIVAGYFYFIPVNKENKNESVNKNANGSVACTMEAKLCPDGSAVGRMPPDCEFAPCPNENSNVNTAINLNANTSADETAGLKTYTNKTYNYQVSYSGNWEISDDNAADVFFKSGTYGSDIEGGDSGIRIEFYNAPDDMATLNGPLKAVHYNTLADWIQANKKGFPELVVVNSNFLGLKGYEAAWPAMAGEYKFFLEKSNKIMVISLEYLNSPARKTAVNGRPEFTSGEQSFFDTFEFAD